MRPAVPCCLVHHWYGEPDNKIVSSFNNIVLGPRALNTYSMYKGSQIMELDACGLELEAWRLGLDACSLALAELGA